MGPTGYALMKTAGYALMETVGYALMETAGYNNNNNNNNNNINGYLPAVLLVSAQSAYSGNVKLDQQLGIHFSK